ncbi:MAG: phosphoribosyltransferase [Cyanophyceae cyanobacterium]
MSDLFVSWSEYHQNIETLAAKIYQSGWNFDQIICIAKGGLRVGDILCRLFEQPLAILSTASYHGTGNRIRSELEISQHLSMVSDRLGSNILLVDDLVDSGVSLREAMRWLEERFGADIEQLRTAVIWCKGCSEIIPDYYVQYLPDNPWIHQPFEKYEQMSPADLAASKLVTSD